MEDYGLSDRLRVLGDRLFQNKEEKERVFQADGIKLSAWLQDQKCHRVSFSPNGKVRRFVLITLDNDDVGDLGATETLIERLESGKVRLDGQPFPGERRCFVCDATTTLQWTSLPLVCKKVSPRAQLLMFTCSGKCRETIRSVRNK